MDIGVKEITDWHVNGNGWSDIGYHWVIRRDGSLEAGRAEETAGAHAKGHNSNSIGVCMVGGMNEQGGSDCNFTISQYKALAGLINDLKNRYSGCKIIGHRDISKKDCPCFDVKATLGEIL